MPQKGKKDLRGSGWSIDCAHTTTLLRKFLCEAFQSKEKTESLVYKPVINEKIVFSAWDLTLGLCIKLWSYNKK